MSGTCVACGEVTEGKPLYKKLGSSDCQVDVFTALHDMQLLSLPLNAKNDHYICWDCDETVAEEYAIFLKIETERIAKKEKERQEDEVQNQKLQKKLKLAFKKAQDERIKACSSTQQPKYIRWKEKQKEDSRFHASHCLLCNCSFEASKSCRYQRFSLKKKIDDCCDVGEALKMLGGSLEFTDQLKKKRFVCCPCYNKVRRSYKSTTKNGNEKVQNLLPIPLHLQPEKTQEVFRRPTAEEHAAEIAKLIPPSLADMYKVVTKKNDSKKNNHSNSSYMKKKKIKKLKSPSSDDSPNHVDKTMNGENSDDDDYKPNSNLNFSKVKKKSKTSKKSTLLNKNRTPNGHASYSSEKLNATPKTPTIRTLVPKGTDNSPSTDTHSNVVLFGICNVCGLGYNSRPKDFWHLLDNAMPTIDGLTLKNALEILETDLADVNDNVRQTGYVCKPCYSRVCNGFRSQILHRIAEKKGVDVSQLGLSNIKVKMLENKDAKKEENRSKENTSKVSEEDSKIDHEKNPEKYLEESPTKTEEPAINFQTFKKKKSGPLSDVSVQDMNLINLINKSQHLRYKGKVVVLDSVDVNLIDLQQEIPSDAFSGSLVRLELLKDIYLLSNFCRNLKDKSNSKVCIFCNMSMKGIRTSYHWLDDPVLPPNLMVPLRWARLSLGAISPSCKRNFAKEDGMVCEGCYQSLKNDFEKFVKAKVTSSSKDSNSLQKYKVSFDSTAMNIVADPLEVSVEKKKKVANNIPEEDANVHTETTNEESPETLNSKVIEKETPGKEVAKKNEGSEVVKAYFDEILDKTFGKKEKYDDEPLSSEDYNTEADLGLSDFSDEEKNVDTTNILSSNVIIKSGLLLEDPSMDIDKPKKSIEWFVGATKNNTKESDESKSVRDVEEDFDLQESIPRAQESLIKLDSNLAALPSPTSSKVTNDIFEPDNSDECQIKSIVNKIIDDISENDIRSIVDDIIDKITDEKDSAEISLIEKGAEQNTFSEGSLADKQTANGDLLMTVSAGKSVNCEEDDGNIRHSDSDLTNNSNTNCLSRSSTPHTKSDSNSLKRKWKTEEDTTNAKKKLTSSKESSNKDYRMSDSESDIDSIEDVAINKRKHLNSSGNKKKKSRPSMHRASNDKEAVVHSLISDKRRIESTLDEDSYSEGNMDEDNIAPFAPRKKVRCATDKENTNDPDSVGQDAKSGKNFVDYVWQTLQGICLDDLVQSDVPQPLKPSNFTVGVVLALNDYRIHIGASLEQFMSWLDKLIPLELKDKNLSLSEEKLTSYIIDMSTDLNNLNSTTLNSILPGHLFVISESNSHKNQLLFVEDPIEYGDIEWHNFLQDVNLDALYRGQSNPVSIKKFSNGFVYASWRVNKLLNGDKQFMHSWLNNTCPKPMRDNEYSQMVEAGSNMHALLQQHPSEILQLVTPIFGSKPTYNGLDLHQPSVQTCSPSTSKDFKSATNSIQTKPSSPTTGTVKSSTSKIAQISKDVIKAMTKKSTSNFVASKYKRPTKSPRSVSEIRLPLKNSVLQRITNISKTSSEIVPRTSHNDLPCADIKYITATSTLPFSTVKNNTSIIKKNTELIENVSTDDSSLPIISNVVGGVKYYGETFPSNTVTSSTPPKSSSSSSSSAAVPQVMFPLIPNAATATAALQPLPKSSSKEEHCFAVGKPQMVVPFVTSSGRMSVMALPLEKNPLTTTSTLVVQSPSSSATYKTNSISTDNSTLTGKVDNLEKQVQEIREQNAQLLKLNKALLERSTSTKIDSPSRAQPSTPKTRPSMPSATERFSKVPILKKPAKKTFDEALNYNYK